MRSFGSRRGNTAVRFMVEQSARRRLWASLGPERGGEPEEDRDPLAVRWTREFFERVRRHAVPRMALVEPFEDRGELRFHGGDRLSLWALTTPLELVIAYEHGESPVSLRERARRWLACLTTRTAPGLASRHWGHPVYGARLDPRSDELDVVWAVPGDWLGIVASELPMPREHDLPQQWEEMARA
ncbi:MAG: hypothetical protein IT347_07670 [Candidatus Eisenbacteria bacterium]|nr:hypothetical protein [Candidatus Eisenbacteria bacterium]